MRLQLSSPLKTIVRLPVLQVRAEFGRMLGSPTENGSFPE